MIALLRKVNHDETRPSSDEERTPREEEIARMEVAIIRMPSSLPSPCNFSNLPVKQFNRIHFGNGMIVHAETNIYKMIFLPSEGSRAASSFLNWANVNRRPSSFFRTRRSPKQLGNDKRVRRLEEGREEGRKGEGTIASETSRFEGSLKTCSLALSLAVVVGRTDGPRLSEGRKKRYRCLCRATT